MATQPSLLQMPFAANGDRTVIPATETDDRYASLPKGFPEKTSYPIADGGVPPRREDFNGILYTLSSFAMFQQAGGQFTYNTQVDYNVPSIIYYNGDLWWCLQANGPSTTVYPPGSNPTYWIPLKRYLSDPLSAYPVGSYYISSNSTSPATLFGGTWVRVQDRMILAAGSTYTAGSTGGSATKTLALANMPKHNHSCSKTGVHTHAKGSLRITGSILATDTDSEVFTAAEDITASGALRLTNRVSGKGGIGQEGGAGYMGIDIDTNRSGSWSGETASNGEHKHTIGEAGSGTAFNIMPPYIVAYVWRRTA